MMKVTFPKSSHAGFALISSLSILLLLMVIMVGILSLSTVEVRKVTSQKARSEAQANARLAMMLALGELQQQLGPDQRISASGGILDSSPETADADGIQHPRYLGVWSSWDTWLTDEMSQEDGGSLKIQDTYGPGRSSQLFRRWLVSHPEDSWVSDRDAVKQALDGESVKIVGKGTLGGDARSEDEVRVPVVETHGRSKGAYAWWVGDESQKATINLHNPSDFDADFQELQLRAANVEGSGVDALDGLDALVTDPDFLERYISFQSLEQGLPVGESESLARHFHSVSPHSRGLLTDVRSGKLKTDLSLLFEKPELPPEMSRATLFHGVEFDAPVRPMIGELAKISPQNPYVAPPSWRQMYEYYRLYRTFGRLDRIGKNLKYEGDTPSTRRFMMGVKDTNSNHFMLTPDTDGYARQPCLLRQTWILATRTKRAPDGKDGDRYYCYLVGIPVFYLWNPYSVEMHMGSKEIAVVAALDLAANLRYSLYRGSTKVVEKRLTLGNENGIGYSSYQARPVGNQRGGNIVFQPGEVLAFTVNGAVGQKEFDAIPGYEPLADTSAVRGLQVRLMALEGAAQMGVAASERPNMALRFQSTAFQDDNYWLGNKGSGMSVFVYQHNEGRYGMFDESSRLVKGSGGHNATAYAGYSFDWLTRRELRTAIIPDQPALRAEWDFGSEKPQPIAIISMTAKGAERFDFAGASGGYAADYRNRAFLHAPPTGLSHFLMNPTALNRADSAYQIYFRPVNGDQEVSEYIQVSGDSAYFGGGWSPASGQTHVPILELPTSPPTSLAAFATMRVDHARAHTTQKDDSGTPAPTRRDTYTRDFYTLKHVAHIGGATGVGIGNSHGHPMVDAGNVYHRHRFGKDRGHPINSYLATNMSVFDDYWDHLFLLNEGLWDSHFFSSMVGESSRGRNVSGGKNLDKVVDAFFSVGADHQPLRNHLLKPLLTTKKDEIISEVTGVDGHERSAGYLLNQGAFNVNSDSVDAWKAFLWGLRERSVPYHEARSGNFGTIDTGGDEVVFSRFRLPNGNSESDDPSDQDAWTGVRFLDEGEIAKLAEDLVEQVKRRGPFLNMADFINRRLSNDRMGVSGALQAAIDSDEFKDGYSGSSGSGINAGFKSSEHMITSLPANYPNPLAAKGSRFAGAPGYLMQSDVLQAIGNQLTVRGDTFRIRSYGDARDADGKVLARAWCEVIVQRYPEYLDPGNSADEPTDLKDGSANPDLLEVNAHFGRRMRVVSFRWLNADEV